MSLLLEPISHTYLLDSRTIVPGVTSVLADLTDLSKAKPQDVEVAKERGTNAHLATAFYDRNDLDESSLDRVTEEYLDGYKRFLRETGFKPIEIEKTFYHSLYGYATTIDRLGWFGKNLSIVELKATSIHSPVTGLQTAAQLEACNFVRKAEKLQLADRRYAVRLMPGNYNMQEYKDTRDLRVFLSCLTRHAWRLENDRQLRKRIFAEIAEPILVGAAAA